MATIDDTGITPRDLTGYKQLLEGKFRDAYGADLALDSETPQGQMIGFMALVAAELDEIVVSEFNGLSIYTASGIQLDNLVSLLGITRNPATYSTVEMTLTGVAGTVLPRGSRVRNADGSEFATLQEVTLEAGDNSVDFQAVKTGPIAATAASLTVIVSLVNGWETATNADAATQGRDAETDAALVARYERELAKNSRTTIDALRAQLNVVGVTRANILENTDDAQAAVDGINLDAHSIKIYKTGGLASQVNEAIKAYKGSGVATNTTANNEFEDVTEVPVTVTINLAANANTLAAAIREKVLAYANENWEIGQAVDPHALNTPVYSVTGAVLSAAITVANKAGGNPDPNNDPNANVLFTLASADITIS